MGYKANVLKVMIASPGDVPQERTIITEEVYRWNDAHASTRGIVLQPIRWESNASPELGAHPQDLINKKLLADADIVVAVFGTRIGTATEAYVSGTVEEIKRHVAARRTAMLYFSEVPVSPSSIDSEQYRALTAFKAECQSLGLYSVFSSHEQFRRDFSHHLSIELNKPHYVWMQNEPTVPEHRAEPISSKALEVLKAAAEGDDEDDHTILHNSTLEGESLRAGLIEFMEGSARENAAARAALKELEAADLIEEVSEGLYRLTSNGYTLADTAIQEEEAAAPVRVDISILGQADKQALILESKKRFHVSTVDLCLSSNVVLTSIEVERTDHYFAIPLVHEKLIKLFNAPRNDLNPYDRSGPAKLLVNVALRGRELSVSMPVLMEPAIHNNAQWLKLTGKVSFQF